MTSREEFPPWVIALGLAAVAFIVYEIVKGVNALPNAIANNPLTQALSSGIADAYVGLTSGPTVTATGMLADQLGNELGPISSFPATTQNGITYLNVEGTTYQLGPRNSAGDFTALPMNAPAGGSAPGGTSPGVTGATY